MRSEERGVANGTGFTHAEKMLWICRRRVLVQTSSEMFRPLGSQYYVRHWQTCLELMKYSTSSIKHLTYFIVQHYYIYFLPVAVMNQLTPCTYVYIVLNHSCILDSNTLLCTLQSAWTVCKLTWTALVSARKTLRGSPAARAPSRTVYTGGVAVKYAVWSLLSAACPPPVVRKGEGREGTSCSA